MTKLSDIVKDLNDVQAILDIVKNKLAVIDNGTPDSVPAAPITKGYTAQAGKIYKDGKRLKIRGVNWFGLENSDTQLHGLWTGRTIESFVEQMRSLGFNAMRIPVAPQTLESGRRAGGGPGESMGQLHTLLDTLRSRGMYALLDLHKCNCTNSHADKPGPGLPGYACGEYSIEKWIKDLEFLAKMSQVYSNVIGIDLFNEPYGFEWTQWSDLATIAGAKILKINPEILIFVEGVSKGGGGYGTFWGEDLTDADKQVPTIPRERLVYSPHVYGPSVFNQGYFAVPQFPGNLWKIWDVHFGHLIGKGFTLCFGEWGGTYKDQDRVWQDEFAKYLKKHDLDWFYWCLNPNSGDTGGILKDDWQTVNEDKARLIKSLL